MASNYEDVRAVFAQIREGDMARVSDSGVPVSQLVAAIVVAVRRDVRAADRLAAGRSTTQPPVSRAFAAISDWRAMRAFAAATREDVLAAWENTFNDLFSFVNDLSAETLDADDSKVARHVIEACAYLRSGVDRWPARAAELRQAIDAPRSTT